MATTKREARRQFEKDIRKLGYRTVKAPPGCGAKRLVVKDPEEKPPEQVEIPTAQENGDEKH